MSSEQEEAYTKLLLHAKDAVDCGATNIYIFSPDTDILILVIRRYPELCLDTNFVIRLVSTNEQLKLVTYALHLDHQ